MNLNKLGRLLEAKYSLVSEAETQREKYLRLLEEHKMPPGKPSQQEKDRVSSLESPTEQKTPKNKEDIVSEYLAKNPPTPAAAQIPAQIPAQIVAQVKRDLINMYDLYVNSDTAKEPVLQMLSDAGEPFSKGLIKDFERLISNVKKGAGTIENIYGVVKAMRDDIKDAKGNKTIRESIHNAVRATKESERNYREHVKSKFEMILTRIFSILDKQAKLLHKFIPDAEAIVPGVVEPQRKELSKEKLSIFMKSPAAQTYGLDNINVMQKILFYPELRARVTTLVNAIDRGHLPVDGPEVAKETAEIVAAFKLMETNEGALEQSRLPNPQLERSLIMQKNDEIFEKNKQNELAMKYDPEFVAQQQKQEAERLKLKEVADQDNLNKEQDLMSKYNSLSFSDWLKRSSK